MKKKESKAFYSIFHGVGILGILGMIISAVVYLTRLDPGISGLWLYIFNITLVLIVLDYTIQFFNKELQELIKLKRK